MSERPYFRFRFEEFFSWFFHRKSKKSAIFLLPVYLAYCPRKHATCWATHVDHFHQVCSWYDYPSPSYSVVGADTLRDHVTFDLLTLDNGQTWQVTWATPPPSLKIILRLSVLDLWVMMSALGHRQQCVWNHCAFAVSRDLCIGGKFFPNIWNPWPRFVYSLCNPHCSTIKVNRVICQNSVRPCVKGEHDVCACAKSRDL